jgi:hypothetical protein
MDKAEKRLLYHLRSALGARDSRNRVSWLSAHLLDFPAHEAYRKELRKRQIELNKQLLYDPSSTLSLVRKWGPSTRNILRSMEYAALGLDDPIEMEAKGATERICSYPSAIFDEILGKRMPRSEGSSALFLRRYGSAASGTATAFIPTPHLQALFEERHKRMTNRDILDLIYALSSHSLTRGAAGWLHEKSMHDRLGMGAAHLSIFRGSTKKNMRSSNRLLPGTLNGLKKAGVADSFYWIPSAVNFPGVDSVLGDTDGHVYTIQATIADKHTSPVQGIEMVWKNFKPAIRTSRTWHFVIVTDSEEAAGEYVKKFSKELRGFKPPVQVWACAL